MGENEGGFTISVEGSTDCPVSNVLEKGRYLIEVKEIEPFNSQAGNLGIKVKFIADGVRVGKWFVLKDISGNAHQMSYQWRQFLYASGFRDKRTTWAVNSNDLIGKKCMADIIKKDDQNGQPKNEITFFSPIEEQVAPIAGVPPEQETPTEKPKEKPTEKPKGKPGRPPKAKEEPIEVEGENTEGL